MVVVNLAAAVICFLGECYPALVGDNTPPGDYALARKSVLEPGYGGDVLVYRENEKFVWAIHRVYAARPQERRIERLRSRSPEERRGVTNGCVNVMPDVYDRLIDCCSSERLVIVR